MYQKLKYQDNKRQLIFGAEPTQSITIKNVMRTNGWQKICTW
jgi:hypothetical protein